MEKNLIEQILSEHIEDQDSFFVFPTQLAADLWADRATLVTSVTAVAVERFIAWDRFKSESIRSSQQDKKAVPSAMRQIFASAIIKENAEKAFFSYIITKEYNKSADSFTQWIAKMLPELALWKGLFDSAAKAPDEEDKDLLLLYEKYSAFLESYGFFDPAWETSPFKADGRHYYIFFPEIFSDYIEYEAILRSSPDITIVNLPEALSQGASGSALDLSSVSVKLFSNSRMELKYVTSYIRKLHEEKNIPWTDIAVNVPDLESYGAYISRDFSLYQIPHVIRNATKLSASGAGSLFSLIKQCASSGCDYKSLYALLLDTELPWKDMDKNRSLLEFGRENHCICNFEYNNETINVWDKSFEDSLTCLEMTSNESGLDSSSGALPTASQQADSEKKYVTALRGYFRSLRSSIEAVASSTSFEKLRENYFAFRERFFDMSKCPSRSDLILSRCIKELGELIDLEKEYFSGSKALYRPESFFSFFVDYISDIQYLGQTNKEGVQILPYKLGSCAPFACHIVLDTSQTSVSVIYDGLHFLQESKRRFLMKADEKDCTEKFLRLYMMNSSSEAVCFTAAEKTFSGYAQACSCLSEEDMRKETESSLFLGHNPYAEEKSWLLSCREDKSPDASLFPDRIPESVQAAFFRWLDLQAESGRPATTAAASRSQAPGLACSFNTAPVNGSLSISKTRLRKFFSCPYKWLFEYGFKLEEKDDVATLMNPLAYGNLYHKIFELFLTRLKGKSLPLTLEQDDELPDEYKDFLLTSIDEAIISIDSWKKVYANCYLSRELLNSAKKAITDKMLAGAKALSKVFNGCLVDAIEEEFSLQLPEKSYSITGRIDCLLRNPENDKYFLVDFKTKKAPTHLKPEIKEEGEEVETEPQNLPLMQQELIDFQMPLYLILLRNGEKKRLVNNACFFIFNTSEVVNVLGDELNSRNPYSVKSKKQAVSPELFQPFVDKTLECLDFYAECVGSGKIETDPEVQTFKLCVDCSYKGLCRKTFNVGRKD